jgi:hypothetical protein
MANWIRPPALRHSRLDSRRRGTPIPAFNTAASLEEQYTQASLSEQIPKRRATDPSADNDYVPMLSRSDLP